MDYQTLKNLLQTGSYVIVFTKADGNQRRLLCTLQPEFLPPYTKSIPMEILTSERLSVWDIENKGWRSFRIDSIISVRPEHESIT